MSVNESVLYGNGPDNREFIDSAKKSNLFNISQELSFYSCMFLVVVGLTGNMLTIYVLSFKQPACRETNRQEKRPMPQLNSSVTASSYYMIALALSDSVFLFAHFLEDILPSIKTAHFITQLSNRSELICRTSIFFRNASRMYSSFLMVSFAYERYIAISAPLKKIRFHRKRFTRNSIICLLMSSLVLASHSLIINGLRSRHGEHETSDDSSLQYECDVKENFKPIYDYIVLVYVMISIVVPLVLLCYFNAFIIRVLLKRKNHLLKRNFFSGSPGLSSSHESDATGNGLQPLRDSDRGMRHAVSLTDLTAMANSRSKKPSLLSTAEHQVQVTSLIEKRKCSTVAGVLFTHENAKSSSSKKNSNAAEQRVQELLNQSNIRRNIRQKLKESGRATIILILISAFYVGLNVPYVTFWARFFIPYKLETLTEQDQVYSRYAFVHIGEIFHVANFALNIFLYSFASKPFRVRLRSILFKYSRGKQRVQRCHNRFEPDNHHHHHQRQQQQRRNNY
nr:G protein-coupled receptor [Proales similis]